LILVGLVARNVRSGLSAFIQSIASDHEPRGAGMPVAEYQSTIEGLVVRGRSFREIEDVIEDTPLNEEQKAALWLLAWSYPDVRAHKITTARGERPRG
jgi:hypothetical protein